MTERRTQLRGALGASQTPGRRLEDKVLRIIEELTDGKAVAFDSRLKGDLGFDSLNMMELCVALEGAFKIIIGESIIKVATVQELIELVRSGGGGQSATIYDIENFPLPKTKKHLQRLKQLMSLSRLLWRFEISGLDNLPTDGRYILCPNHQSHFDGLWIWSAIEGKRFDLNKICCLAKQEHLKSSGSRFMLAVLGGIPIDRSGNVAPAMKRGLDCIKNGYTMLIHPEGTRTLDGKIQKFKGGAAKLAIDAGVPIIPVRIDGAWDIFPPHKKRPKIFRFGSRYPIIISFGKPIKPDGKSVEDLTGLLQGDVEKMGSTK
jgi:long-chain acyl-CoA synthetase